MPLMKRGDRSRRSAAVGGRRIGHLRQPNRNIGRSHLRAQLSRLVAHLHPVNQGRAAAICDGDMQRLRGQ